MRFVSATTKVLLLLFLASLPIFAQSTSELPDAHTLISNIAVTYRAMKTYSASGTNVMEVSGPGMQQKMEFPMTITGDSAGKMRMETHGAVSMLMVSDGENLWMYLAPLNKYTKLPFSKLGATDPAGAPPVPMPGMGVDLFARYRGLDANVKEARVLRSETIQAKGSDVSCWVLYVEFELAASQRTPVPGTATIDPRQSSTLWVEKTHYLVYREDSIRRVTLRPSTPPTESKMMTTFEEIRVNQPVGPDTFTFTPPPGATEMDLSGFIPKSPQG